MKIRKTLTLLVLCATSSSMGPVWAQSSGDASAQPTTLGKPYVAFELNVKINGLEEAVANMKEILRNAQLSLERVAASRSLSAQERDLIKEMAQSIETTASQFNETVRDIPETIDRSTIPLAALVKNALSHAGEQAQQITDPKRFSDVIAKVAGESKSVLDRLIVGISILGLVVLVLVVGVAFLLVQSLRGILDTARRLSEDIKIISENMKVVVGEVSEFRRLPETVSQ